MDKIAAYNVALRRHPSWASDYQMDKIAAYDTVLRRHPLWEADYQEKEAGLDAALNAAKGGATKLFKATGIGDAASGLASAAKGAAAGLRSPGSVGTRLGTATAGAYSGVAQANRTPAMQFLRGNILPY